MVVAAAAKGSRGRCDEVKAPAVGGAALSGVVGLIEVEVRDGLRLGGIEDGRLVEVEGRTGVEVESGLGWAARRLSNDAL